MRGASHEHQGTLDQEQDVLLRGIGLIIKEIPHRQARGPVTSRSDSCSLNKVFLFLKWGSLPVLLRCSLTCSSNLGTASAADADLGKSLMMAFLSESDIERLKSLSRNASINFGGFPSGF